MLSVLIRPVQDVHQNSINICSLADRGDVKDCHAHSKRGRPKHKAPDPTSVPEEAPQAHGSDLLLLRGHRGQVGSMGHTELLSLLPRLLGRRKVIQVPIVGLPVFHDQLEKLIWSKGGEGERTRSWMQILLPPGTDH